MITIKNALISVSDKTQLIEFANELVQHDIQIYSTGGTLKTLQAANINALSVSDYTKSPEILSGRVKTLHPKIHGGILANRTDPEHQKQVNEHEIILFDLVCINLYPFEQTIKKENVDFKEVIENIDIGGPTMIRSAAKNFQDVVVLTDIKQYSDLLNLMKEQDGAISLEQREKFARKAFQKTAMYDSIISSYLENRVQEDFPNTLNLSFQYQQDLRYGENPHQKAAYYRPHNLDNLPWNQIHGKDLSYNNLLDLDVAIRIGTSFSTNVCAILKHSNPCGLAAGGSTLSNLELAIACDPVSYFGGIVVINEPISLEVATKLSKSFFEIILAESFTKDTFSLLSKKKNIRLIEFAKIKSNQMKKNLELKMSSYGLLIQESNIYNVTEKDLKIVTTKKPSQQDIQDLLFAFQTVKFLKSNAIVFTKNNATIGIGVGQMSRLDSLNFSILKAKNANHSLDQSILASDAFFPFRDCIDIAVKENIKGIIQPGGSIRDEESIAAANEAGLFMAFTNIRYFSHG